MANRHYEILNAPTQEAADALTAAAKAERDAIMKPRAAPVRRSAPGESEREILKAIMSLLKRHPKVARVWRQNSGTFQQGERYIRANTARGMSDIAGLLKHSGRSLYIEVKTRTGRVEQHQQQFIDDMTAAGAVAFIARSVDDVVRHLAVI